MKHLVVILVLTSAADAQAINPDKQLEHTTDAIRAFLNSESPIPKDLVGRSQCIVAVPGLMKGAFLFGEKYGRGFASCRKATGGWSSPAAIAIEGGSIGPQLGGSSTDLIMLVMKARGMEMLLGDKFALGGEASVAAGPVGGTAGANTDALMAAEIICYSRSKGIFSGLSLEGATLRPDGGENKKLYGREVSNREVLSGKVLPPKGARAIVALLVKHARKPKS